MSFVRRFAFALAAFALGVAGSFSPVLAQGTSIELLSNPGFETGIEPWVGNATSGENLIYSNSTGDTTAHSGQMYAWLGGYNNGTDSIYQTVTIPSDAAQVSLQFWYHIIENDPTATANDTMAVEIYNAQTGARLATLATFSNLDTTLNWVQSPRYDLSAFKGQTVRVAFTAVMDDGSVTNFYLDDVSVSIDSGAANYTALWWNPAESGWGINLNHQGDIIFATLFTYDSGGNAMWLVMSAGYKQSDGSYRGTLYRTTGPPFNSDPFTPITAANLTEVGTMSLAFSGSQGTLVYNVGQASVTKTIQKQVYGSRPASCVVTTSDRSSLTNYQDLWWNPAESGWGINLTHQDDTLFATLFSYDATGQDLWLVMSDGHKQSDGSYVGTLFRTTGPVFNAQPFTPIGQNNITTVGTMRLQFANGTSGTLTYSVNGVNVTKSITRQVFSSPVPACS